MNFTKKNKNFPLLFYYYELIILIKLKAQERGEKPECKY